MRITTGLSARLAIFACLVGCSSQPVKESVRSDDSMSELDGKMIKIQKDPRHTVLNTNAPAVDFSALMENQRSYNGKSVTTIGVLGLGRVGEWDGIFLFRSKRDSGDVDRLEKGFLVWTGASRVTRDQLRKLDGRRVRVKGVFWGGTKGPTESAGSTTYIANTTPAKGVIDVSSVELLSKSLEPNDAPQEPDGLKRSDH